MQVFHHVILQFRRRPDDPRNPGRRDPSSVWTMPDFAYVDLRPGLHRGACPTLAQGRDRTSRRSISVDRRRSALGAMTLRQPCLAHLARRAEPRPWNCLEPVAKIPTSDAESSLQFWRSSNACSATRRGRCSRPRSIIPCIGLRPGSPAGTFKGASPGVHPESRKFPPKPSIFRRRHANLVIT